MPDKRILVAAEQTHIVFIMMTNRNWKNFLPFEIIPNPSDYVSVVFFWFV